MIVLDVQQRSQAWHEARMGIPTASNFHRILSPKKLEPSSQAMRYLCEKVAERVLGVPMDYVSSGPMERGTGMEDEAARWYEFQNDCDTPRSGMFLTDDRRAGCSVDRLIGEHGILEIKCPLAPAHIEALLNGYDGEHRLQCQGQMWISERQWCDLLSFFPGLPPVLVRVERDEEVIAKLSAAVVAFCDQLDKAEAHLRGLIGQAAAA